MCSYQKMREGWCPPLLMLLSLSLSLSLFHDLCDCAYLTLWLFLCRALVLWLSGYRVLWCSLGRVAFLLQCHIIRTPIIILGCCSLPIIIFGCCNLEPGVATYKLVYVSAQACKQLVRQLAFAMAAYVKLRSVTSGERYALPGVGLEPDFLVPTSFDIQDIVNGHLAPLKLVSGGGYALIEKDTPSGFIRKEFELSTGVVTGFVDQQGAIRMYGSLRGICDADGFVGVYFGKDLLREEVEEVAPLMDLSGVATPPTPPLSLR